MCIPGIFSRLPIPSPSRRIYNTRQDPRTSKNGHKNSNSIINNNLTQAPLTTVNDLL